MVKPILPEGSGDEESPEEPVDPAVRAAEVYTARMWLFNEATQNRRKRVRRAWSDYCAKNCEEAWPGSGR